MLDMLDNREDDPPTAAVMMMEIPEERQKLDEVGSPGVELEGGPAGTLGRLLAVRSGEVVRRAVLSAVPARHSLAFYEEEVRGRADLYGPFWVPLTLALLLSVASGILACLRSPGRSWSYDPHSLASAALAVVLYAWLLPLVLWALLRFYKMTVSPVTLAELLCIYGYSLTVYVPAVVMCLLRNAYLQFALMFSAAVISSTLPMSLVLSTVLRKKRMVLTVVSLNLAFTLFLYIGFIHN